MRFFSGRTSKDAATIANETIALLDDEWASLDTRMLVVPGKRLLSMLNTHLQQTLRISITPTQIIRSLSEADLNAGLVEILPDLDRFSANQPESVDANTARAQPLAS
jgi:hypothetical protein